MDGRSALKLYSFLSIALPSVVIVCGFVLGYDVWSLVIVGMMSFIFTPLMAFGLYMWTTGRGQMWINGVEWKAFNDAQSDKAVRIMGLTITGFSFILLIGISFLFGSVLIFVLLFAVGLILVFYAVYYLNSKKFKTNRRPVSGKISMNKMITISVIILAGSAASSFFMLNELGTDGEIHVNLNEDNISIEGPFFNYREFAYSDIDHFYLDDDFEKGKRTSGYGTSEIKSGHFRNSQFGDYILTSYAKIKPCIVLYFDNEYYVFNQSSADDTYGIFETLKSKMLPKEPGPPL